MTNETIERDLDDQITADDAQGPWVERYEPRSISDLIVRPQLEEWLRNITVSDGRPNILFVGPPGIGKTSATKIIAAREDTFWVSGATERGRGQIAEIADYASTCSFTGGRKLAIVDDVDLVSVSSQQALCNAVDEYAGNCGFIFTANEARKLIPPLRSRCMEIDLTPQPEEREELQQRYQKRIDQILKTENVDFDAEAVESIIRQHCPDFRRILNEVQGRFVA